MAQAFLNSSKYDVNASDVALLVERSCTRFVVPDGIKRIGPNAFAYSSKLEEIIIPEGIENIGSSGMSYMTKIKKIDLPKSCAFISSYSLQGNAMMEAITFGKVETIQIYALQNNPKCLSYDFTRSEVVPTLDNVNAFNGINANAKILVPASLYDEWITATNWSVYKDYIACVSMGLAFEPEGDCYTVAGRGECTDSVIIIPPTHKGVKVTGISAGAFDGDATIETLILPESGINISGQAFSKTPLKEIQNYYTGGSFALYGCDDLELVTVLETEYVDGCALCVTSSDVTFDFTGNTYPPVFDNPQDTQWGENVKILVSSNSYEQWVSDTNWVMYADKIIPKASEGLEYSFDSYENGYSLRGRGSCTDSFIVVPETYDDGINGIRPVIFYDGFENDDIITGAYIPGSITYATMRWFKGCGNLKNLYAPGVSQIESFAFCNNPSLKYVKFPNIKFIGGGVFFGLTNAVYDFTSVTSIPSIDSYGAGSEFGTNPTILVPSILCDEWKNDTNWVNYAEYIVAAE